MIDLGILYLFCNIGRYNIINKGVFDKSQVTNKPRLPRYRRRIATYLHVTITFNISRN